MSRSYPSETGAPPEDWDLLQEEPDTDTEGRTPPPERVDRMAVVAASWGDLVTLVTVVTAALATVLAQGRVVTLGALPWAAALATVWWLSSAGLLLLVRRATPGMLMAGVSLTSAPRGRSLAVALAVAMVGALTIGLAAWPFGRRPLIARLTGFEVETMVDQGGT